MTLDKLLGGIKGGVDEYKLFIENNEVVDYKIEGNKILLIEGTDLPVITLGELLDFVIDNEESSEYLVLVRESNKYRIHYAEYTHRQVSPIEWVGEEIDMI